MLADIALRVKLQDLVIGALSAALTERDKQLEYWQGYADKADFELEALFAKYVALADLASADAQAPEAG